MLQDGSRSLKLYGSAQARIGKDILEHGVRQACASLLRQGVDRGVNPMLHRHGQAAEPGLQRLMDFTVFAAASDHDSFDPREHSASVGTIERFLAPISASDSPRRACPPCAPWSLQKCR